MKQGVGVGALGGRGLEELAAAVRARRFERGEFVLRAGAPACVLAVVEHGWAKVLAHDPQGRAVMLGLVGPGGVAGEPALVPGGVNTTSLCALEPVEARLVDARALESALGGQAATAAVLTPLLIQRLRAAHMQHVELVTRDVLGRVAHLLAGVAGEYGRALGEQGTVIDAPIQHEDLAQWAGASREAVSKALARLEQLGLLLSRRRPFVIPDIAALAAVGS